VARLFHREVPDGSQKSVQLDQKLFQIPDNAHADRPQLIVAEKLHRENEKRSACASRGAARRATDSPTVVGHITGSSPLPCLSLATALYETEKRCKNCLTLNKEEIAKISNQNPTLPYNESVYILNPDSADVKKGLFCVYGVLGCISLRPQQHKHTSIE
jgi:hypothetical protein